MADRQQEVTFQTILRLRPHQKKERDDPVLLERVANTPNAVILHPPQKHLMSPSSALVRQTLSPEAAKTWVDSEYRFDGVFWPDMAQDKLYYSHGLPIALSAMEPLKDSDQTPKNHLIVAMGAFGSGKSYTVCGSSGVSARKSDCDGLLPRLFDSLFSQSKHQFFPGKNSKKKYMFSVRVSFLQVNQNQTKPQQCTLHDLLQTPSSHNFSLSSATSAISSLSSASSLLTCASAKHSPVIENLKHVEGILHSSSTMSQSNYSQEDVFIEQDSQTSDFRVVNALDKYCDSDEQAREVLHLAWKNRSRLSNRKRYQTHVYVTMQPVLLDRVTRKALKRGGTVAVIDMSSFENPTLKLPKQLRGCRDKETVAASANDGYSAIINCLTTLRHNNEILARGQSQANASARLHQDFKKIPYRQHLLTMLMQPLFGSSAWGTSILLVVTAYTGHRDFPEKRALMDDVSTFFAGSSVQANTGLSLKSKAAHTKKKPSINKRGSPRNAGPNPLKAASSDTEKRNSARSRHQSAAQVSVIRTWPIAVAPGIPDASSSDLEDDASIIPLPPPVAPSYLAGVHSLEPSAPVEGYYESKSPSFMHELTINEVTSASMATTVVEHQRFLVDCSDSIHNGQEQTGFDPQSTGAVKPLPLRSALSQENHLFSPMKTISGMVSASKKKSKEVIEMMSYPLPSLVKVADNKGDPPNRKMILENKKLAALNETLIEQNQRLEKENEALRVALLSKPVELREESIHNNKTLSARDTHDSLIDEDLMQFMVTRQNNSHY